jgi:hypothetical protein
MQGYATGISNGFLCVNDVRRLENMDLVPDSEEGGNLFLVNGSDDALKNRPALLISRAHSDGPELIRQMKRTETEQDDPDLEPEEDTRTKSPYRRGRRMTMNKFWKWVRNKAPDGVGSGPCGTHAVFEWNNRFGELV